MSKAFVFSNEMSVNKSKSLYISGEWRESQNEDNIEVKNPATEDTIAGVAKATSDEVHTAIEAANDVQYDWGHTPAKERGDLVRDLADLMETHREELAQLIVKEQGKPIDPARGEIDGAVDLARYMAEWDRRIEGDILPGDKRDEVIHLKRLPIGVVAGILPWNYPIALFSRKVAPALVAGNTVVLKPSEVTPVATLRLFELIDQELEFPDGVLNLVTGDGITGSNLVSSPEIDMISMTGNVETGKEIMQNAANNLTKVSLELGGKAPAIVWKDADISEAVDQILTARIANSGQVCTCAERIYVHSDIREKFEKEYVDAAKSVEIGPPNENPDMGPQVSQVELEKTERAVENAIEEGATVKTGGKTADEFDNGYWYEPTVVTDVNQDMSIMKEEVFGPVSPIMEVSSLDEAIDLSNDSKYGLSSYLYTNSYHTAMRAAEDLDFGELYINRTLGESWQGHHIGWNQSGLGGEDGKYGFLKYTQLKTVYHNYGNISGV